MSVCAACQKETPAHQLMMSSAGEVCPSCLKEEDDDAKFSGLHTLALSAAVVAGMSFFVSVAAKQTVNGRVVYFRDWAAIGLGSLACILAVASILAVLPSDYNKLKNIGAAALAIAIGLYRVAYGLGMFV